MKKLVLLIAFAGFLLTADAQVFPFGQNLSPEQRRVQDSIREVIRNRTNKDYSAMLQLLNISSVRPGVNGSDPTAPNGVNYDETKANPFPVLPDPLRLNNGDKVNAAKIWWSKRRPEIIEDFDREIYGRIPKDLPAVNWEIISSQPDTAGTTPVIIKKLIGRVDNSSYPAVEVNIELTLITPADIKSKVPVIMEFNGWHERSMIWRKSATDIPAFFRQEGPSWQEQVLNRGWALALLNPSSIQADHGAGLTEGIIGLINKGQYRKADDWGALRAWHGAPPKL